MNGADWTKRYPRILEEAARLRVPLIIDAEVVHLSAEGVADFQTLHSRTADEKAVAVAFDLLSGDDIRRKPLIERKAALKWVLRRSRGGIQYVEHAEDHGVASHSTKLLVPNRGSVWRPSRSLYSTI
jgi:bifunctional non-homologous end joining protein LigD